MNGRSIAAFLLLVGLAMFGLAIFAQLPFGESPMQVGQYINAHAASQTGAANIVTAILLGYRGLDTLGEVSVLFAAASAASLVFAIGGKQQTDAGKKAGFIFATSAGPLVPFLMLLGAYIILHGHLTPGGGFQGGAILAAAIFVPMLADPSSRFNHTLAILAEGLAGLAFIAIGAISLLQGQAFLAPQSFGGQVGALVSAGAFPLLYIAIGVKVGAELAGLMVNVSGSGRE